ncbi:MAG: CDP-alcohol phosphatidyltransferase family protein [Limisphaerales bacterium]
MTTANKVTIARILLIPVFVVETIYYTRGGDELHRFIGLIAFAVAAISDGIDGYIARRYNQKSELGAILDPLADKLLLISGILLLSLDNEPFFRRIPLWLTGIVLSRDVILVLGLIVIHYTFGAVKVRPRAVGKIATFFQMALVLWILLKWNDIALPWLAGIAGALTALSGILYFSDGIRQLSASPTSSPINTKNG